MDYEHQPNSGPGLWVGSGLLMLAGGLSFLFVQADSGDVVLAVFGGVLVLAGLAVLVVGVSRVLRIRRD